MPELPEVETLCRQLATILPGQELLRLEVLDPRLGTTEGLAGRRVEAVSRQGKGLRIALEGGLTVSLHLRMTGRLLWRTDDGPVPPHARLRVTLAAGTLFLIDPRRFATCRVQAAAAAPALLENPLTGLPARRLREIAAGRRVPVKTFLMDQRLIAGIGNIYACEICHGAGIDPGRPAGGLSVAEWRRVEKAADLVLPRAVACRGTTVSDWRDLFGCSGTNQEHLAVYGREGEACPRCGARIARVKLGGRGTWFCPACQK